MEFDEVCSRSNFSSNNFVPWDQICKFDAFELNFVKQNAFDNHIYRNMPNLEPLSNIEML